MIYSTLGEMRAMLYSRLGIPNNDSFLDVTEANRIVNQATQQVDLAHPWPWTVKSSIVPESTDPLDEGSYVMPNDYVTMVSVSTGTAGGANLRYLERRPYDEVRQLWASTGGNSAPSGNAAAVPIMWAERTHGTILTAPQASSDMALEFRYRCTSPLLTGDPAVSLHPSRYDEMYTAYAAYLAGLRFRELPETGGALAQFDALLERYQKVFPIQNFGGEALSAERGKVVPTERG